MQDRGWSLMDVVFVENFITNCTNGALPLLCMLTGLCYRWTNQESCAAVFGTSSSGFLQGGGEKPHAWPGPGWVGFKSCSHILLSQISDRICIACMTDCTTDAEVWRSAPELAWYGHHIPHAAFDG